MAYTIVLDFQDEDEALQFARVTIADDNPILAAENLKGIYKRPTQFCPRNGCGRRPTGYVQGQKWGWWVCATCRKPSIMVWQNIWTRELVPFGFNLLDRLFPKTSEESQS